MKPEEHVRRFSSANDRKLKSICDPLNKLGIDTFWYYTISESGHLTYLGNQSPIAEYFFHHELFVNHPNFRSPTLMNEGAEMFRKDLDKEKKQEEINNEFSMNQIFLLNRLKGGAFYGYGFATTGSFQKKEVNYFNKIPLLNKFVSYFHKEADSIIKNTNENKVHISPMIGEYFDKKSSAEEEEKANKDEFLTLVETLPKISYREQECLSLAMKGKSSREIGEILYLSKRTVEHYFESIKNKWNCLSKSEMIEKGFLYFYGL
jgi:DNA-binding CsgD family transcriptional regulator